jgi:hypothetical protein
MRGNGSLTKRKDVSCPAGKSFHLELKIQSLHERVFAVLIRFFPSSHLLPVKRAFQCKLLTVEKTCHLKSITIVTIL